MSNGSSKYRPDIDGLRAVAIAGVLIFHIFPQFLTGGYVGVDVFFVISGFLITSIIYRDLTAGKFSLVNFYERRIRRIVPALFFMLLVAALIGWKFLLPDDFASFSTSLAAAVGSISNIFFLDARTDYFNNAVSQVPLIHTWSLGVEEQFYLFFPFLMICLHRFVKSPKVLLIVVGCLLLVSLGFAAFYVDYKPLRAFFLLPFRAWEMLLGGLLALAGLRPPGTKAGNVLGVTGLGMIVGSMVLFTEKTPFPGFAALLPCVGAALLIFTGRTPNVWTARLLSLKPIVWLGLISYSVYLWHWPLIAFAKYSVFYSSKEGLFILPGSLILGALSWRFVERPFRNHGFLSRKKVFILWAAASVLLVTFGLVIQHKKGVPHRFSAEVQNYQKYKYREKYDDGIKGGFELLALPKLGDLKAKPTIAVWGDSHAEALIPLLDDLGKTHGKCMQRFGRGGVPPVVGVVRKSQKYGKEILDYSQQVLDFICNEPAYKTVILSSRWSLYTKGFNENPGDGLPDFRDHPFATRGELEEFYAAQIRITVKRLLDAGKKVAIVYPIPEIGYNVPDYLSKISAAGQLVPVTVPLPDYYARQAASIRALDSIGENPLLTRIYPQQRLMSGNDVLIMREKQPLYFDDDHLSAPGAFLFKDVFEPLFQP